MKRPEQTLHVAVARYLTVALRPPTFWTSIDHASGMKAGRLAGALRKARGVKAGLPDILVMHPISTLHGPFSTKVLGIELKAKGNYASPEQKRVANDFGNLGATYRIAWSVEDVAKHLSDALIPTYAKLS